MSDKYVYFFGPEGTEGFLFLSSKKRIDNLHELTMRVQYNRWLVAKVSYTFQINDSNSYGDSYYNHRLMVALSKGIFQRTNLHLLGIFQFRDSSDPVLNPHSYDVEEDDENLNSVTFKISQGILDWLALELKYSRYWYEYSSWRFDFQKNLYSLGIGFKF